MLTLGAPRACPGDKGKDKPAADARTAILEHLRQRCATDADLRGAFISKDSKDEKAGALVLRGFVDNDKQRSALEAKAKAALKPIKAWSDAYPGGVDVSGLSIVPLRSTLLPKIRRELLADVGGDTDKDRVLARTRLDDVFCPAAADELAFTGVCIASGADAGADKGAGLGHAIIKNAIEQLLQRYAVKELSGLKLNVAGIKLLKNPVPGFQEKFTRGLGHDGVFFKDARYNADGTLLVACLVDRDLAADLPKLFKKHFGDHAALAQPEAVAFDDVKAIAWPIHTKAWNDRLLSEKDHRRTTVMRAYPHYFPGDLLGVLCEAYFDSPLPEKEYKPLLEERLRAELGRDWPALRDMLSGKDNLSVELKSQASLRSDLQADVIKKLGLTQVWIEDARFDSSGVLQVSGLIAQEGERKQLATLVAEGVGRGLSTGRWSVDRLTVEDWAGKLRTIQQRLAAAPRAKDDMGPSLFDETRLDKLSFGYSDGFLETRFTGLTFHDRWEEKKLDFRTRLLKETLALWPGFRDLVSIDGIKTTPRPDHLLQTEIGKVRALDGVFIEKASFDKDGKLLLEGFWRGPAQEKGLRALADATFKEMTPSPHDRGLLVDGLQVVRTDLLLRDLQRFAAESLEDVQVLGLYFDKDGAVRMRAAVREERAKQDIKRLRDEFERLKKYLPGGKTLKLGGLRPAPAFASLVWVAAAGEPDEVVVRPSLTRHLRDKVLLTTDPYWDGVLIDRGFFDADGHYHLVGLVDNVKQREALRALLRDLAKLLPWRDTLEKEPNLDGLKKLELAPLREALKVVMPEYEEFDYMRLDRIYHTYDSSGDTTRKVLEFAVYMAEPRDKKDVRLARAKTLLASLIADHPEFKVRVNDGVELKPMPAEPDERAARLALARALKLLVDHLPPSFTSLEASVPRWAMIGCTPVLIIERTPASKAVTPEAIPATVLKQAVKYLDVGLLHYPDDTTAWFLRAASYLALGEKRLAARDLRRLNKIELADGTAREARLAALDLFQGELRLAVSDLAADERIESASGRRLLTLRDVAPFAAK